VPRLVLAGLPFRTLYQRDKSFEHYFNTSYPGWTATVQWSERQASLAESWEELKPLIASLGGAGERDGEDGLHILAFHSDIGSRQKYRAELMPYHRLRFLDTALMREWGRPPFRHSIDVAVAFEALWREHIRPTTNSHPLLLPAEHFRMTQTSRLLWQRSAEPQSEADIADIAASLMSFCNECLFEQEYCDLDGNRFQYKGPFHAQPQGRDDWRFTYRMPNGFHYDVQPPVGKQKVSVSGRSFNDYVNAYPNGLLRTKPP